MNEDNSRMVLGKDKNHVRRYIEIDLLAMKKKEKKERKKQRKIFLPIVSSLNNEKHIHGRVQPNKNLINTHISYTSVNLAIFHQSSFHRLLRISV